MLAFRVRRRVASARHAPPSAKRKRVILSEITMSRFGLIAAFVFATPTFAQPQAKKVDFAHDVVPILKARCAKCHTNGTYKGSLSLDTRESLLRKKAATPDKSADSEMIKRVTSNDPEFQMPPEGERLSAKEIATLKAWIDEGLAWEPGFSFKIQAYVAPLKPRRPAVPPGDGHPIDRILGRYLAAHKVTAQPPLDDAAFARRAYLDLIGLLPATSELDAFLADASADKRAKLVRHLLGEDR